MPHNGLNFKSLAFFSVINTLISSLVCKFVFTSAYFLGISPAMSVVASKQGHDGLKYIFEQP